MALNYAQLLRGVELILADRGIVLQEVSAGIKLSAASIQYWDTAQLGAQPTMAEIENRVLLETKNELYATLSQARYNLQNAGITIPGVGLLRTDRDIVTDLGNIKEYLRLKVLEDQAKPPEEQLGLTEENAKVSYKVNSGQPRVEANIAQLEAMGLAVGDYWQLCFAREEAVEAQISGSLDIDYLQSMIEFVKDLDLTSPVPTP